MISDLIFSSYKFSLPNLTECFCYSSCIVKLQLFVNENMMFNDASSKLLVIFKIGAFQLLRRLSSVKEK